MRKLWILVVLTACFGLAVPGCGGGDEKPEDKAKGAAEDAKDKAKDAMDKTTKPK